MAKNKNNAAQGQLLKKAPLPKMPEGYYSGDKPNPNLRKFAEEHCTLYDPENDSYAVRKAFNSPVDVEKRKSPITDLHIYWSKKPPDAIREYIKHYSKPGDLVLDPFSGSGMTSMVCRELGRHSIAIDLSPAATFITKNYCTAVDAEAFRAECQRVLTAVKAKHGWLYETKCDRCGESAEIAFMVYSFTTQCVKCLATFPLAHAQAGEDDAARGVCPECGEGLNRHVQAKGYVPIETSYICKGQCKPKRGYRSAKSRGKSAREYFRELDLGRIKEVEKKTIPFTYPNNRGRRF